MSVVEAARRLRADRQRQADERAVRAGPAGRGAEPFDPPPAAARAGDAGYAAAALHGEVQAVRAADDGTRNHVLNRAAFSLGQLVAAGVLDEAQVVDALTVAARHAGLDEREIGKTIASGLTTGRRQPRTVPPPIPLAPDPSTPHSGRGRPPAAAVVTEPEPAGDPTAYGPTEDGLARALVAGHGRELRYCPQRGRWLRWTGSRWCWDDGGHHRELVRELARRLPDDRPWRVFKRRALSAAGVSGVVRLAQSDPAVVVHVAQLDAHPWELNTPAGVVDLTTGKMGAPDPARLHTRSTWCAPDSGADPDMWSRFLRDTFAADQELIGYLQRLVGYSAVGVVGPHILPFAFGSGGNGKGVFLEAIAKVLGDYATTAPVGFLMAHLHTGHETEIARLAGARMVICSEVNEDDRFDEAKVKQLTGGDTLTARFIRQDHFTFTPTHQLWLMGNSKPAVRSGGPSFWRRLRLIPFDREVPEDQVIEDLQTILAAEHGPALLAWIVAGAVDYATAGLREPEKVKTATAEYAHDQNTVARFVEDRCRLGGGEHVQTRVATIREAYETWCVTESETAVSATALTLKLKSLGVERARTSTARLYTGITLLNEQNVSPFDPPDPHLSPERDRRWVP